VFVAFITPRFVNSENCINELEFALGHHRPVLAVYLEATELPPGLELSLGSRQGILKDRYQPEVYEAKLRETLAAMLEGKAGPGRYPERARARRRRPAAWLVATAAVLVLVALLFHFMPGSDDAKSPDARFAAQPSIAVLPFVNMSGNAGDEYFSDGLTEETISLLADLAELRVAARTSSFYYKGKDYRIPDVARRLSVDVVLEGSVRRQQDQVRITAQLIDAESESIVWTGTFDRRLDDIFSIQRNIAREVANALEIILSSRSEDRLQRHYTDSLEAYDAYLKGRAALRQPKSEATLRTAIALLEQAIELDRSFAQAYAGLCEARLQQYELTRTTSFFEQAESACLRALTRDAQATETHLALGTLHYAAGQHAKAGQELRRAIELNPTSVDAHLALARNLADDGQPDAAEVEFRRAIELDPSYWDSYQLFGNFLYSTGRYAEAAENYRQVIERSPDNAHAWSNLGAAHYLAGDFKEAARAYEASLELAPNRSAYSNTGTMYYYAGDYAAATRMYRKALELAPDDGVVWGNLGDALSAGGGPDDEAKQSYERALELTEAQLNVNPNDAGALAEAAYFSARLDQTQRASELLAASLAEDPDNTYTHYFAALVHERAGRDDEALAALARAVQLGYPTQLLEADPGLRRFRDDARFTALLQDESGQAETTTEKQ
jgi:tetratricopeptide (TPR) repeat protein